MPLAVIRLEDLLSGLSSDLALCRAHYAQTLSFLLPLCGHHLVSERLRNKYIVSDHLTFSQQDNSEKIGLIRKETYQDLE